MTTDYKDSDVPYYNLKIKQGSTWSNTMQIKSQGTPIALTGYNVQMEIRESPGGELIKRLTSPSGGITLDEANGRWTITLTSAETKILSLPEMDYDIALVSGAGVVTYIVQGKVLLKKRSTQVV